MSIEQHIEELRAEHSWCENPAERRQIETELKASMRRWQRLERARQKVDEPGRQ